MIFCIVPENGGYYFAVMHHEEKGLKEKPILAIVSYFLAL